MKRLLVLDRSNLCCVVWREVRLEMDERSSSAFNTVLQVFFFLFLYIFVQEL